MDKKTVWGLVIIGVILFGYTWYGSQQQQQALKEKQVKDSIALINWESELFERKRDSVDRLSLQGAGGDGAQVEVDGQRSEELSGAYLRKAVSTDEKITYVENDVFRVGFSSIGGKIESVELKDYKSYHRERLELIAENSSLFSLGFHMRDGYVDVPVFTGDYNFECLSPQGFVVGKGDAERSFVMRLAVDSTSHLDFIYTFEPDNYMIDFRVDFSGMEGRMSAQWPNLEFDWDSQSYQNEKGFNNENNYTTIAYRFAGKDGTESISASKSGESKSEPSRIDWIAFKQQFFSSVFISDNAFENSQMEFQTFNSSSDRVKNFSAKMMVPFNSRNMQYDFKFYYGPNKFSTLKKYDLKLEKLVPLGSWITGWVNRWLVIPVFDFLGKYISSFGLIILILTIIIKIIITPLTYKSYLSTAKMRLLKPEMDELSAKYPKQEDAVKKQQAVMDVYKKAGVSPMGGCIPVIIQLPILIAMFRFFPASIELRGESFLWADDLSSYDSILDLPFSIPLYGAHVSLFALLMGASIYLSSKINYNQQSMSTTQMPGMKFMMLYMMPIMMILWFNNYSSGLSYYYLLSNIITIGQTFAFRYAVNDKKLHARMKENSKKPVKKSKFQERIEAASRQQQQLQAQKQQQHKRKK